MIALLLAAFAMAVTCPPGSVLSHGVPPSGIVDCYRWSSQDFERDDTHVVGVTRLRLFCRRGTVPVVGLDGKSAKCVRLPRGDA